VSKRASQEGLFFALTERRTLRGPAGGDKTPLFGFMDAERLTTTATVSNPDLAEIDLVMGFTICVSRHCVCFVHLGLVCCNPFPVQFSSSR
jgi:hypothetical protein